MTDDQLEDEVMARDIYPAEVLMPDGTLVSKCRAFVTSHRAMLFVSGEGRTIVKVAELELAEQGLVPASRNTLMGHERLEIRTADGTAWINRGRGCGCGSVLKALGAPVPWTRREKVR